jgi:hypothetical protein
MGDAGAVAGTRFYVSNAPFKQPLLWFALVGILLFVVDEQFSIDRNEIIVTAAMQERLGTLWTKQTGLVASAEELDALVENWIREEILYQEALRLGLDQEDSIVRRRLVQKLGFIAETGAIAAPERNALQNYYESNIDNYTLPVRYSFQQLYFNSAADAQQALGEIGRGTDVRSLGESSMLNSDYAYRSALDLNATFGAGFADPLAALSLGGWQGPIRSGFGFHLILLNAIHLQESSPYESVRQQVLQDFRRVQQMTARETYVENLLDEYKISVNIR